jgi:molybdenum cofactor cytidylyltransferase
VNSIACLLLAAGNSTRFGGSKQLALVENEPMVLHSLNQLKPVFHDNIFVVLGAYANDIRPLIEGYAQLIHHANWASGIGSSIAKGIREISSLKDYRGIMIALADQAALTSSDYSQLWQRFDGESIIAAGYKGKAGVPAIFPDRYYRQLRTLNGDQGARDIIRQHPQRVLKVNMPNAMLDIDTRNDLMQFQETKSDTAKISL